MRKKNSERLYDEYYLTATGLEKWYIRETVALNLTGRYNEGFTEIQKTLKQSDLKRLLGLCAAWWKDRSYNDTYVSELVNIKCRMGMLANAENG